MPSVLRVFLAAILCGAVACEGADPRAGENGTNDPTAGVLNGSSTVPSGEPLSGGPAVASGSGNGSANSSGVGPSTKPNGMSGATGVGQGGGPSTGGSGGAGTEDNNEGAGAEGGSHSGGNSSAGSNSVGSGASGESGTNGGAGEGGNGGTIMGGAVATVPSVPPLTPVLGSAGPALKVDLDMSGRPSSEVTEPGYTAWPVETVASLSKTLEGVTFTFSRAGNNGTALTATWSKAAVQAPNLARLAGDGLTVEGGEAGAQVDLTIAGLPAGQHTLLTLHNHPGSGETFAPIDILVNGAVAVNGVEPTLRQLVNSAARSAYVTFSVEAGESVVISFRADTSAGAASNNIVINSFELDTPDAAKQAFDPSPVDQDEHVDADTGALTLSWSAGPGAVSHDVYLGNDRLALQEATPISPSFKGNQASTSLAVDGMYSIQRYYWRVDEVGADGSVTQGDVWYFRPRQAAFPSAEGYGRFAIGGRGGVVVHVTNLNDSGPGSLRDAVETDRGPRTIVFDVAGIIPLASRLTLSQSYVTVAGQTAPGKGICIRAAPFGLSGVRNVVVRNVRVRVGHGQTFDGMGMQGSDHSILDHCSVSWTIDEAFSSRSGKNITLQRTLISEALNVAGHQNYPAGTAHGYAASISGDIGSFHHNLLAHCEGRNWSLAGGLDGNGIYAGRLDIFNNVVYNWGHRTTDGGAHEVNFVGNYYKPGAATEHFLALTAQNDGFPGTQRYYVAGNVMPGHFDEQNQADGRAEAGTAFSYDPWVTASFFPSHATVHSAADAYKSVLSDVGMTQPVLDDHDLRVINETLSGSTTYEGSVSGSPGLPDHEDDVGGYEDYPEVTRESSWDTDRDGLPDWWETARGLSPASEEGNPTEANTDLEGDGFTELDRYLEWMAKPHYFVTSGETFTVDLAKEFLGYTSGPTYAASNALNGTVDVAGASATFTPAGCGFASLRVEVQDSAGSSMTKEVVAFVACP